MSQQSEAKPKKSFWAFLRESMDKASSGCGPGCGCHIEKRAAEPQREQSPGNAGSNKGQA
jgi:hypothetical protein